MTTTSIRVRTDDLPRLKSLYPVNGGYANTLHAALDEIEEARRWTMLARNVEQMDDLGLAFQRLAQDIAQAIQSASANGLPEPSGPVHPVRK